jgi:hypothetical protein
VFTVVRGAHGLPRVLDEVSSLDPPPRGTMHYTCNHNLSPLAVLIALSVSRVSISSAGTGCICVGHSMMPCWMSSSVMQNGNSAITNPLVITGIDEKYYEKYI